MKMYRNFSLLFLAMLLLFIFIEPIHAQSPTKFKRIPLQYIVAIGDANASEGDNAQWWGLWNQDPGPRGCRLESYPQLERTGIAPAHWAFDKKDFWLEEHGLIMEKPVFPLLPGKYVVTGGRKITSILTVDAADRAGAQHWQLDHGAKLYDVTHLPCHAARYTSEENADPCSPQAVNKEIFPVAPGVSMPSIKGCKEKEYSVLFVIGLAE